MKFFKKGLEMQQLILIIIAVILLLLVIAWYSGLGEQVGRLLEKFSKLL